MAGGEVAHADRKDIRFWFRNRIVSVSGLSPQTTVLRWLREHRGDTGTKEGCAEGDCGACTVAVGSWESGRIVIRAVNSCLLFLPALDGKALFTVEDLADGTELHPVQRAMIDKHASQCGFCTPGFVMSLWADYQTRETPPTREEAERVLAGNLCRCTGYRPIFEAAEAAWTFPERRIDQEALAATLQSFLTLDPLRYEAAGQTWIAPRSADGLAEAAAANPDARLVAGATDVGLWVTKGLRDLGTIISIGAVAELKTVHEEDDWLTLGAGLSLTDAFETLARRWPETAELGQRFASPPVRNAGTLGGNVANGSPIGDSMPLLLALGAHVVLRRGSRTRVLPLDEFYLAYQKTAREPGEVLVAIRLPLRQNGQIVRTWKVSKRRDQDISAVCAAFSLTLDDGRVTDARVAYGGMAATPKRAVHTEEVLIGKQFDQTILASARTALAEDFSPLTDGRATSNYRSVVAANLLTRLHAEVEALR
jgi:xanthine dehydrogenase small subunit